MEIFYLIYTSFAHQLMDDDELLALYESAAANNKISGITGMLLYKNGHFMQYIEGDKEAVLGLYQSILSDKRHYGAIKVVEGETDARNFKNWSMGFCHLSKSDAPLGFDAHTYKNIDLRSFGKDVHEAYNFIRLFNQVNRQQRGMSG